MRHDMEGANSYALYSIHRSGLLRGIGEYTGFWRYPPSVRLIYATWVKYSMRYVFCFQWYSGGGGRGWGCKSKVRRGLAPSRVTDYWIAVHYIDQLTLKLKMSVLITSSITFHATSQVNKREFGPSVDLYHATFICSTYYSPNAQCNTDLITLITWQSM